MGRPKILRSDTEKIISRLDVLERLLADSGPVHPVHCDCAIKSRTVKHHLAKCPYRQLKELCVEIRQEYSEDNGNG